MWCAFRCNGEYNCPDRSDEADCDIISVDDSYLTYYPAPPVEYPEYPDYPTATGTGTGSGPSATSTGEFLPPEIPQ